MTANIVETGENIRITPVVDPWSLSSDQRKKYPLIDGFIELEAITDIATLRALLIDLYPKIGEGEVKVLLGGFCLLGDSGEILLEPQCCADFGDVDNWDTFPHLVEDPEKKWIRVWLGHPHTDARREGENVWLALDNDTDKYPVLPMENSPIVSVSAAALGKALNAAYEIMKVIETRFDQALTGVISDHLRAAAIDLMLHGANGRYDWLRDLDGKEGRQAQMRNSDVERSRDPGPTHLNREQSQGQSRRRLPRFWLPWIRR